MLIRVIQYSGIHAKIKALESGLLVYDDYYSLAGKNNVADFAKKLAETESYREIINELLAAKSGTRIPIERSLVGSMYDDFSGVFSFITNRNERNYLDTMFLKYEIGIIKALLRRLYDRRSIRNAIPTYDRFISRHLKIDVEKLFSSKNFSEFLKNLEHTKFHSVLNKIDPTDSSLFDVETQLDLFCYLETWKYQNKYLSKSMGKILERINGADIDLHNIMHIYRLKTYYDLEKTMIYSHLIPIQYRIGKDDIEKMIDSKSSGEFETVVAGTHYKNVFTSFGIDTLERDYYIYMTKVHNIEERRNPYSLALITSYFHKKGQEIRNLTTLLECVRYGLDPEKAMLKLNVG